MYQMATGSRDIAAQIDILNRKVLIAEGKGQLAEGLRTALSAQALADQFGD